MIVRMRMGISVTVSVRISECKYTLENKAKVTDLSYSFTGVPRNLVSVSESQLYITKQK